jgi:hypothetical protein
MRFGDKYKFSIAVDGALYKYVTLAKTVTISGSREEKTYRFNKKSSAWRILRSENFEVYTELLAKLVALNTATTQVKCRVELYDDWVTLTEYTYEGYFYLSNISVDEDGGVIEFTPDEGSLYDWYDEHKGDKYEIMNIVLGNNVLKYDVTTVCEKYIIPRDTGYMAPNGFHADTTNPAISNYSREKNYTGGGWDTSSWSKKVGPPRYFRCTVDNGPSTEVKEPYVDPDWENYWDEFTGAQTVYRQVSDLPFGDDDPDSPIGSGVYIHGNGLVEEGFPAVTKRDSERNNLDQNRYYFNTGSEMPESGTMIFDNTSNTTLGSCFKLFDPLGPNTTCNNTILDYLLKGSGLTVHSHFFEDAVNPVTGLTNKLTSLRLAHCSFIKGINDYSTTCEVSLDQLISDLCNTFCLLWYISGAQLIIEHVNFFENGFQYTGSPLVYTDLTSATYPLSCQVVFEIDGTVNDKEYKYATEAPEKEIFHFNDGYDYDGEIWYDSKFAKRGQKTEYNISSYITDFAYLLYNRTGTIDDGLCLVACGPDGTILRRATGMRWIKKAETDSGRGFTRTESVAESDFDFPNGDLQWHNLLTDFWGYYAYFLNGRINNQATPVVFQSQKRIKKQREIIFPRLEPGAFDPYKLITTHLGNGQVKEYEIGTDTDFIKVTLLY